ncbi:MAG: hypothetical protein MJZ68_09670 [archaeon]|nr:hypothetical protein [archaeon]
MTEVRIDSNMLNYIVAAAGFVLVVSYFLPWVNGVGCSYNGSELASGAFSNSLYNFQKIIPTFVLVFGFAMVLLNLLCVGFNRIEKIAIGLTHEIVVLTLVLTLVFFTWGIFEGSSFSTSIGPIVALTVSIVAFIFATLQATTLLKSYIIYS